MIDDKIPERDPTAVFTVAVSCGLAFWLGLGLLALEWRAIAGAAASAGRLLHSLLV